MSIPWFKIARQNLVKDSNYISGKYFVPAWSAVSQYMCGSWERFRSAFTLNEKPSLLKASKPPCSAQTQDNRAWERPRLGPLRWHSLMDRLSSKSPYYLCMIVDKFFAPPSFANRVAQWSLRHCNNICMLLRSFCTRIALNVVDIRLPRRRTLY